MTTPDTNLTAITTIEQPWVRCPYCDGYGRGHCDEDGVVSEMWTIARDADGEIVVILENGEELGEHEARHYVGDYSGEAWDLVLAAIDRAEAAQ